MLARVTEIFHWKVTKCCVFNRFELHGRESCPPVSQPVDWSSVEAQFQQFYSGMEMQYNVTGLTPYTKYDWRIVVYNSAGSTQSSITSVETCKY